MYGGFPGLIELAFQVLSLLVVIGAGRRSAGGTRARTLRLILVVLLAPMTFLLIPTPLGSVCLPLPSLLECLRESLAALWVGVDRLGPIWRIWVLRVVVYAGAFAWGRLLGQLQAGRPLQGEQRLSAIRNLPEALNTPSIRAGLALGGVLFFREMFTGFLLYPGRMLAGGPEFLVAFLRIAGPAALAAVLFQGLTMRIRGRWKFLLLWLLIGTLAPALVLLLAVLADLNLVERVFRTWPLAHLLEIPLVGVLTLGPLFWLVKAYGMSKATILGGTVLSHALALTLISALFGGAFGVYAPSRFGSGAALAEGLLRGGAIGFLFGQTLWWALSARLTFAEAGD